MKDEYLWIIGGGLLQIPLIEQANLLGLKTIVSDQDRDCVAKEHSDVFFKIDIFDVKGHINSLRHNSLNVIGVLAAGIDAPETMAAMNSFLGLKGISSAVAHVTKQKDLFRKKLKELGYDVPKFVILKREHIDSISDLIEKLPFPVIVKPTDNSASRDMKIFTENTPDLKAFVLLNLEKYELVLVEELWEGEEQTVECLVDINGQFHNGFITDRKFTFQNGYPVETGLIHPTELQQEKQNELFSLAKRVADDLNIDVGAVKLDTIYTKEGPRIIELTVRHSGGFDCQYLVPNSTGKNILKAAILTAVQKEFSPKLLQAQYERYGKTASPWPEPGIIKSITGIDSAKKLPGIVDVFMRYNVGDTIEPYINCATRVAFIIATGLSREDVNETIDNALKLIEIEVK
ncbi:MAG: ATP-grasp domain-containing protein [Gammaproteobacteria bacterium]|nr:ATP-grasp domain-containing protein [Gammaproteobacteria bacterium]